MKRTIAATMTKAPMLGAALAALMLAGCGDSGSGAPTGDPVDKVAAPAGQVWSQQVTATPQGMLMGNPDAPIKLVEYGSFTCSHCAEFSRTATAELKRDFIDSGRVSYEFRSFVRNGLDLVISGMVNCAGTQRFFPLAENVFASQEQLFANAQGAEQAAQSAMALPEGQRFPAVARAFKLDQFFASRGLSTTETDRCLADFAGVNKFAQNTEQAVQQYEVNATPTFLINGQVAANVAEWGALRDALRAAGAR